MLVRYFFSSKRSSSVNKTEETYNGLAVCATSPVLVDQQGKGPAHLEYYTDTRVSRELSSMLCFET